MEVIYAHSSSLSWSIIAHSPAHKMWWNIFWSKRSGTLERRVLSTCHPVKSEGETFPFLSFKRPQHVLSGRGGKRNSNFLSFNFKKFVYILQIKLSNYRMKIFFYTFFKSRNLIANGKNQFKPLSTVCWSPDENKKNMTLLYRSTYLCCIYPKVRCVNFEFS